MSQDQYASLVVRELMLLGTRAEHAFAVVQAREVTVRAGYARGQSPKSIASRIAARKGLSGGMAPKSMAEAAGCKLVPIEAFFFGEDLGEIPPMEKCTPSQPSTRLGLAAGRYAPKRSARRARGQVAGGFNSEDMLYRLATAAHQKVPSASLESHTKRIFKRAVSAQELETVFSARVGEAFQKAKFQSALVSEPKYGVPATLKVIFSLDTGAGTPGRMVRVFYQDPQGQPQAYHSLYEIDGKTDLKTGKGLGALITKNTLLFYRSLGIGSIDTHAEWVGRYVWAAFGFQWSLEEADRKADELSAYLEPRIRRGQLRARGRFGNTDFDLEDRPNPWKSLLELIQARAITALSWKTAALYLANPTGELEHVGKPFLAGVHVAGDFKTHLPGQQGAEGWTGSLVLSDRHPTWQVAKARLGL